MAQIQTWEALRALVPEPKAFAFAKIRDRL